MDQEILRAPPRRIAALKLACLIGAAVAITALWKLLVIPNVEAYLHAATRKTDAIHRLEVVLGWFGGLLFFGVGYMAWVSYRILLTGQWPLPGAFVLRDTPIQRGRSVYFRGLALSVLTIAMAILAILVVTWPQFMLRGKA